MIDREDMTVQECRIWDCTFATAYANRVPKSSRISELDAICLAEVSRTVAFQAIRALRTIADHDAQMLAEYEKRTNAQMLAEHDEDGALR